MSEYIKILLLHNILKILISQHQFAKCWFVQQILLDSVKSVRLGKSRQRLRIIKWFPTWVRCFHWSIWEAQCDACLLLLLWANCNSIFKLWAKNRKNCAQFWLPYFIPFSTELTKQWRLMNEFWRIDLKWEFNSIDNEPSITIPAWSCSLGKM